MASQVESIKKIPSTPFMVDGFAFSGEHCRHYFLTHCHSDHTIGLRRSFNLGTIYCTPVTARVLQLDMGLGPPTVVPLELNVRVVIQGVAVTPLDANHCPGACMFLFEVPDSTKGSSGEGVTQILHTGDCRWQPRLKQGTVLARVPVDVLYLDTTYCKPNHTFPSQQDAIASMVEVLLGVLAEEPLTLIAMAAYHIGKERAFLGAARGLGVKVYVDAKKLRLLKAMDLDPADLALVTRDKAAAQLHVCNWGMAPEKLQQTLQEAGGPWKAIVGVRATGWVYSRSRPLAHWRRLDATCSVLSVPYSEHSSWGDLRECVGSLRPRRVVPTVNAATPEQARRLVDMFADVMDLRSSRRHMDSYLLRPSPPPGLLPSAAAGVAGGACTASPPPADSGPSADAPAASSSAGASRQEGSGSPGCSISAGMSVTRSSAAGPPSAAPALVSAASTTSTAVQQARPEGCPATPAATPAGQEGPGAAGEGEGLLDLEQVDLEQQQRILEEVARVQRLKRSLELQREAKKRQRTAGACGASVGRRKQQLRAV